jgi:hypothetical protein
VFIQAEEAIADADVMDMLKSSDEHLAQDIANTNNVSHTDPPSRPNAGSRGSSVVTHPTFTGASSPKRHVLR